MEQLSFQYPIWLIVFCILGAILGGVLLYAKTKPIDKDKKWLKPLLFLLRALPIFAIGALLLGPLLRQIQMETKRPAIVILSDVSKSVGNWHTQFGTTEIASDINGLKGILDEKYEVTQYAFGDKISVVNEDSLIYDKDITNISDALQYISDVYEGENLGAVILASDGIYNGGQNPLYASIPSNIPIHSIALGDTTRRTDAAVQTVLYNEVAYLGDEMITQVDIKAVNAENQTLRLTIEKEAGGSYVSVDAHNIQVTSNDFFKTVETTLSLKEAGISHYRYRISSLKNEVNQSNNRKDIYVEVLDARQEIGIIAAAPHPDLTALKQILEQNKNYKVNLHFEGPSTEDLSAMDLAIFHNLPTGGRNLKTTLTTLDNQSTPRVYIVGEGTDLVQFNKLQSLITIKGSRGAANNAQAEIDSDFENFTLSSQLRSGLKRYPPLSTPYGEYTTNGSVQTLLYQKLGDITTDFPLLSFADKDGIKTAFLLGNDIWRWKLFDYLQHENFDLITELLDKAIIYTSTKEDKRKFRVSTSNTVFLANEDITISAELYNNNYELINTPEATIKLKDNDGNVFDYTFSKNDQSYLLSIGRLSPGSYSYDAETIFNGEQYAAQGKFVVREIQYELYDLEAQHNLLYALAQKTQGSVSYPNQIADLGQRILTADNIKPVVYQNVISKPLVDSKWLFFLLVIPLILEWLLRRYHGSL